MCCFLCLSGCLVVFSYKTLSSSISLYPGPSGTHVSRVQSVTGRVAAEADGEGVDPAEPEQRTGAHRHEGGNCLPEESNQQLLNSCADL